MARTASGTHAPFMEERRQIILQLLEKRRSVAVGELAQRVAVCLGHHAGTSLRLWKLPQGVESLGQSAKL